MRTSRLVAHSSPTSASSPASPPVSLPRLSVALACAEGEWPHEGWPDPDDPHVGRVLRVAPPYRELSEEGAVDVVVLRCEEPATEFAVLLRAMGAVSVPVIVVSPRRDMETVVEVFRGGAGYLVEGDYCTCMLASAVMAATVGHTYLSPIACAALRDRVQRESGEGRGSASVAGAAMERLRSLLAARAADHGAAVDRPGRPGDRAAVKAEREDGPQQPQQHLRQAGRQGSTDAVLRWLGATPAVRT